MATTFKKLVSLMLVVTFSVVVSVPAFAVSKKTAIPYHMAPGTVRDT